MAESNEPESYTREGTICLANSPSALTGLLSEVGGTGRIRTCDGTRVREWSPRPDLRRPPPLTRRDPRYLGLQGRIGADGWTCTIYLFLTKEAFTYMNFEGEMVSLE